MINLILTIFSQILLGFMAYAVVKSIMEEKNRKALEKLNKECWKRADRQPNVYIDFKEKNFEKYIYLPTDDFNKMLDKFRMDYHLC